jgi:hypothetical protein
MGFATAMMAVASVSRWRWSSGTIQKLGLPR